MQKNKLIKHTAIMTAVNLIMRAAGVGFNAYLTSRIGSSGMGLFQLVMTVYSLATTFSSAGIRLATTRVAVEINTLKKNDMKKSVSTCVTYAGICGCMTGFFLFEVHKLKFKNLNVLSFHKHPLDIGHANCFASPNTVAQFAVCCNVVCIGRILYRNRENTPILHRAVS